MKATTTRDGDRITVEITGYSVRLEGGAGNAPQWTPLPRATAEKVFAAWQDKGALGRVHAGGREYTQATVHGLFVDYHGNVLEVTA